MPIERLSEWLFPGDGDSQTAPAQVSPRIGAAGLLVVAAHRDGRYTRIETDVANAALMKLFHIGRPDAEALRVQAEEELFEGQRSFMTFAVAAKALERDDQEALITHLWRLVASDDETTGENVLISAIRDALGFTRAQAEALRPTGA